MTVRGHRAAAPRRRAALLPFALLWPLAAGGLGLAACEGVEDREPEEVGVEQGAAALDDPPAEVVLGEAEPPMPAAGTTAVEVSLHGRTIEMTAALPPGETTFTITNTGDTEHGFEIEGNGLRHGLESNLPPGETGELAVALEPGSYTIYCPVGDHREEGMVATLRVAG